MDSKRLTIIATKGTLDWAYPPFILASTAAALGYQVTMFFTFYGLQLLKKELNLRVSPLGNPGIHANGYEQLVPSFGYSHTRDGNNHDQHDEKYYQVKRRGHD